MSQPHWNSNQWNVTDAHDTAIDASQKAAPGAGFSHYITDVVINQGGTSRLVTILDADNGNVLLSYTLAANTATHINFKVPIKVGDNKAIWLTTADTSTGFWIGINGFTGREF